MELAFFNVNDGFSEALVRGLRSGFLTVEDYRRLSAAESLDDVRTALDDTDYGSFLQDEPSPLEVSTIVKRAKEKMAHEFQFLRAQSVEPLVTFLDFIERERMIENIVTLIQGTLNGKPAAELLAKVDPMGTFPEMKTIPNMDVSAGYDDIYKTIMIDTPVGPYFEEFLKTVAAEEGKSIQDMTAILAESDLEMMKTCLKKAWLEDFKSFCDGLGGTTAGVMGHILNTEADFKVLLVTLNALNTSLGSAQKLNERNALYPALGYLYPEGVDKIRKAYNQTTVRQALEPYNAYRELYDNVKMYYDKERKQERMAGRVKSMEDMLFLETAKLYELAFEEQFHYGVFYAWAKLREQEIKNIGWICNMITMGKKEFVDDIVPIFTPKV